jgi:hypothetical protein
MPAVTTAVIWTVRMMSAMVFSSEPEGPVKYEIAAREHQCLVSWKVGYLQDVDARGTPGDFFNGRLRDQLPAKAVLPGAVRSR